LLQIDTMDTALLDLLPTGIFWCAADGAVIRANRRATEMWGTAPADTRLFHPDGAPIPAEAGPIQTALRTGQPVRDQRLVIERPDGGRSTVLVSCEPLFGENGALSGTVNFFQDIAALVQAEQALLHQERYLYDVLEALPIAVYTTDAAGRTTFYNEAVVELVGERPEMGEDLRPIFRPGRQAGPALAAALPEQRPMRAMEAVLNRPDGSCVPVLRHATPLFDADGRLIGAVDMLIDITERKQAKEDLRVLLCELNHRVKNTLASVQAIANQTLRRSRGPGEFVASFSGRVQALSRAHALLTESTWRGAEIAALIRDQVLPGGAGDARIHCSGPSLMLEPQAALHMALVLHELATNARRYGALSVPGGQLSVNWVLRSAGERSLLLHWQERGGPKVTVPTTPGFGTTLIEQSLHAHGGEAWVRYAGNGVICEIRLPLPAMPRRQPGAPLLDPQPASAWGNGGSARMAALDHRRVLVIEDEPVVAMDVMAILQEAGCTVLGPAGTVTEARRLIEAADFDVAFLDANLSGQPVDELAAALTARNTPFAFVTGYGQEGLPEAFRKAPVLSKPFSPQQLIETASALVPRPARLTALSSRGSSG